MKRNETTLLYLDKVLEVTTDQSIRDFYRRWLYIQINQLSDDEFNEKIKNDFPEIF